MSNGRKTIGTQLRHAATARDTFTDAAATIDGPPITPTYSTVVRDVDGTVEIGVYLTAAELDRVSQAVTTAAPAVRTLTWEAGRYGICHGRAGAVRFSILEERGSWSARADVDQIRDRMNRGPFTTEDEAKQACQDALAGFVQALLEVL
jgi:hypothetical protein